MWTWILVGVEANVGVRGGGDESVRLETMKWSCKHGDRRIFQDESIRDARDAESWNASILCWGGYLMCVRVYGACSNQIHERERAGFVTTHNRDSSCQDCEKGRSRGALLN